MLGLRYFVCAACDTVWSLPERPARCDRCGGRSLRDITDRVQGAAYFVPNRPGE